MFHLFESDLRQEIEKLRLQLSIALTELIHRGIHADGEFAHCMRRAAGQKFCDTCGREL